MGKQFIGGAPAKSPMLAGLGDGRKRRAETEVHAEGDTERFHRQMPVPALIGIEATGKLSLAGRPAGGIGPRVMGGRRGADPGQLCEAAENRQAGCGGYSEAAAGRPVSAHLGRVLLVCLRIV